MEGGPTLIMIAVNESTITTYPFPTISCTGAFEWTLNQIVRSNFSAFKLLFLNVQLCCQQGVDDGSDRTYRSPDDFKQMAGGKKASAVVVLEYFVDRCNALGITCEAWIKKGEKTKELICSEVKRVQPDLVVTGSRELKTLVEGMVWICE
ncbi:Universal stress protein A-like protein [Linum perenne]